MFWIAILVIAVAITFSTLGAMSVWLKLIAVAIKFLIVAGIGVGAWMLVKHWTSNKES